ncbi:hypothetical protein GOP47_0005948 [Adiantum capillus-veneris]|uniref:WRKY domain-containing protein n=1 Tax=Adiantum capillus-veneris TaxID=13818 RepID=A0A9D4ZLK5_ADICA|nr:hypothetical protein GOP47_0005948 [Adiantum capillus-veneris]
MEAAANPAHHATRDIVRADDHHQAAAAAASTFTSSSTQSPYSAVSSSSPSSRADCLYSSSVPLSAASFAAAAAASPLINFTSSANYPRLPPFNPSFFNPSMESLLSPSPCYPYPSSSAGGPDQLFWQTFMNLHSHHDQKASLASTASIFEPSNLSMLLPSSCSASRVDFIDPGNFESGFSSFSQCLQEGMNMDSLHYNNLFFRQLGGSNNILQDGNDVGAIQMNDDPLPSLSSASLSQSFGYNAEKSPLMLSSPKSVSSINAGGMAASTSHAAVMRPELRPQLGAHLPSQPISSSITTVSITPESETGIAIRADKEAPSTVPGTPVSSISNSLSSDGGGGQQEEQDTRIMREAGEAAANYITRVKRELQEVEVEEEQEEGDGIAAHVDMEDCGEKKRPGIKGGGGGGRMSVKGGGGGPIKKKKRVREARVALITKSEVEHLEDGFRWRKYGQKAVKNSPYPRSYYRCTNGKCSVKKRVERSFEDPSMVITTYEGQHNHHSPALLRGSAELMLAAAGGGSSHHSLFLDTMQQAAALDHHNPHFLNPPSSPSSTSTTAPHIIESGEHHPSNSHHHHYHQQPAQFSGFPSMSALPNLSNFPLASTSSRGRTVCDLPMHQDNSKMHKLLPLAVASQQMPTNLLQSVRRAPAARAASTATLRPPLPAPLVESYPTSAQESHTSDQGLLEDMVSFGARNN